MYVVTFNLRRPILQCAVQREISDEIKYTLQSKEREETNNFDNFIANICRSFLLQQPLVELNEKSLDNVFK